MGLMAEKRERSRTERTARKDSGITWNEQAFREFVSNPAAKVPGTMMLLSVREEKEIGDLWAYLKQFGADGKKRSQ